MKRHFDKQLTVKKISVVALMCGFFLSGLELRAADLESLLEGKSETQQTQNSGFLVNAIYGMIQTANSEQNIFLRYVEKSEWRDALVQWNAAFGNTEFENSDNGIALKSFLEFKNGMMVTGLEHLFTVGDPRKIHFQLISLWRTTADENHAAWLLAKISWKREWSEIFPAAIAVKIQASELLGERNIEKLDQLSIAAPVDTQERALVDWNLALAYTLKDQSDKSAKIVSALLKAKNNPVPEDLLYLTAARMLYQNGYFDVAIRYYDKIPKKSEDYFEAQEEKAWAFVRKGEPQNAIAITQSLVHSSMSGQVGPEAWFLRSLAQLKVCDYPGALSTLAEFPREFKNRTLELEKLSTNAELPVILKVFASMKKGIVRRADFVRENKNLPRNLTRDQKLRALVRADVLLEQEAESSEKIFARSLQLTGLQGYFDRIRNQIKQRQAATHSNAILRVQELAKMEVEEVKRILNKLHIVEAEVIQQVETAPKIMKHLAQATDEKKGSTGASSKDAIHFPAENEFWFDELTNYRVSIKKGCQAKLGTKLTEPAGADRSKE